MEQETFDNIIFTVVFTASITVYVIYSLFCFGVI